jgi:hypothetical protein
MWVFFFFFFLLCLHVFIWGNSKTHWDVTLLTKRDTYCTYVSEEGKVDFPSQIVSTQGQHRDTCAWEGYSILPVLRGDILHQPAATAGRKHMGLRHQTHTQTHTHTHTHIHTKLSWKSYLPLHF